MTVQGWIDVATPTIGFVVATVSAGLTYYFAKKQQIAADERRLKEKYYLNYIEAISNMVVTNSAESARNKLADAQNQLLLIGSAAVVKQLMVFHDYIKPSSADSFSAEQHDELLTDLLIKMRIDLYKNRNTNLNYPVIHLTGKSPRK